MTEDDQKAAKAGVASEYLEMKERHALLKIQIDDIANALERGARTLKTNPEVFGFDGEDAPLGSYRDLQILVEDIKKTNEEIQRLYALAKDGGFEHLLRA